MDSCIERGSGKHLLRLACGSLLLAQMALITGCGENPHSVEHVQVSGKVLFQGKPLRGGRVNFITVKGAFSSSGKIDENGHYQLQAPVGDVQISVMSQNLPQQYQDPQTSGLKFTVQPGSQTHDIELSANPGTTASSPGR